MNAFAKSGLDALLAVGLLGAVLLVYAADPKKTQETSVPTLSPGKILEFKVFYGEAPKPEAEAPPKPLRMAVTPKVYDDMGALLRRIGKGLDFNNIQDRDLEDVDLLKRFDVIFLTCSDKNSDAAAGALRQYVENGGTLYSSDLRFGMLQKAFGEFIDWQAIQANGVFPGKDNITVQAAVVDAGLREYLKTDQIGLFFNSPGWEPASINRNMATVYLEGTYVKRDGRTAFSPLLVKFHPKQKGTVIFTSFHNAAQNSELINKLLEFLIFRTLTAKAEIQMTQQMEKLGFQPQASTLITASQNNPTVTKQYTNKKPGRLRFGLSFNPSETRLRLNIKSPEGKVGQADHTSSFTMEILNAPVGTWEYTVGAVGSLANPTPYSVILAEEK